MENGRKYNKESKSSSPQVSEPTKSNFAKAPSITLPKGGGAINGIGEKFAANPVTGTGSFFIPIAVSPGRSGFSPQLTLSYDSGASNGVFGLGWNLSLPSITRKTEKGIPKYQDKEESDVFLLSGVEDLVPLLIDTGGGNWERRHKTSQKVNGKNYDILFYRPRIEGLFARIERWANQKDPADTFWRTISKDNIATWYGKTNESRISDPSNPNHIFSWLIDESYDDKGHVLSYQYIEENSDNIDLSKAHEQNRTIELRKANRYLKYIKYGNLKPYDPVLSESEWTTIPEDDQWMFEIIFDYGEHDQKNPLPRQLVKKWPVRDDPFSSFRSGFEMRTYRLCQRILMFHHFPEEENVGQNCLVHSTDFTYSFEKNPDNQQNFLFSYLLAVTHSGHKRSEAGGYSSKSLPPVEFEYSQPIINETIREIDAESLENLPYGLDRLNYQWIDLDGEGLNGMLTEQADGWFYKRNNSANQEIIDPDTKNTRTVACFSPLELIATKPNSALATGQAQFMDLAGDGAVDLVIMEAPNVGFYERTEDDDWKPFQAFDSWPNVNSRDPNLRFIDLTGDGLADILISEDQAFVWYASLAEAGFEPARRVQQVFDEDKGPHCVFADSRQSIFLADMSGDGLTDIVRIRNGEVCYWPNIGYCRFGAKVTMDKSPWFDTTDIFDQRRIRLADIDGSGAIDIIYIGANGVQIYFNESGNSWSQSRLLTRYPRTDNLSTVEAVDLLGNGTACLVWSSPLSGDSRSPMKYIDLMGGQKPHLLIKSINNLGAETTVKYAPSTKFYLNDKQAGKSWVTKLPFPMHVVERVEIRDFISHTRFSSNYSYHHGYYDGVEREFRGFAMVEQTDTEAFEDYVVGVKHIEGLQELDPELYQPPVTTRTWFHTGAFLGRDKILHQLRNEYYLQQQHIPEPVLPDGMDAQEYRECIRALKGLPLRSEVYSFDGSTDEQHPYSVVENNYDVKLIQPRRDQKHAVFFTYGCETVTHYYERNPADPRIAHSLNLEIGPYGNVLKSASVVYGRKLVDASLPQEVTRDQQKLYITYGEADYTPDIIQDNQPTTYRLRTAYESRSYEITGITPDAGLFKLAEIKNKIAGATAIPYEAIASGAVAQKRLLSQSRTLFLDNNLNPLPLGQWDTLGLGHESYQLAFTPGVTGTYYAGKVTDADFGDAGYIHFDGDNNWWIPSGTAIYPPSPADHFYIPSGTKDPFGIETVPAYDKYDLLIEQVRVKQATWNVVTSSNDYRVLGPVLMTDPNKNRSAIETDELGMVVKTAIMGKVGSTDGDTLADPTTRMEYELFNWMNNKKPNFVHTFAREQHGAANPRWQESYAYSNGSGGVALMKAQAHPGKALKVNADGSVTEVDADPRWIGNGRTILNNKGKPVKQYEPYFSTTQEYEDEKALREVGVTPILYYDAVGRNIRTLFPNGTFAKVEFTPWLQKVFDANDTVKESQWYVDRGSPDPAQPEPLNNPERRAAWLAAKHANTPGIVHSDSLGRSVYAISDYGGGKKAAVRSESDLSGRFSKLFDQLQRQVADGFTGMAGTPIYGQSAEKGKRWTFVNVLGALVKTWDEHGREFGAKYDVIHRPISTFVKETGKPEILFNYVVYGDRHPNAKQRNLLGVAHQIFDQAGMVRVPELDFKGNPKSVERILAKDYKNNLNWDTLATQPDYAAIQTAANPDLEIAEIFTASSLVDALNRPTQVTLPDNTVILPKYNEANILASLQAQIRGQGAFIEFLKGQDYDTKGQRQFAHYGNDVFTRYFYDPKTFRLTHLLTYKSGSNPQSAGLQNLKYNYDPIGNITQITDDAQQTHYFNNAVVKPESLYEYDAIYQLIKATGRELAAGNNDIRNHGDLEFVSLPHANDTHAVRNYTEEYEYDLLGNITTLKHHYQAQGVIGSGWTRHYHYAYQDNPADLTNRLVSNSQPGDPEAGPFTATYDYDAYGNMIRMPHLTDMAWNFMDQLKQVDLGGGGTAFYVYGLSGQRIRKIIERQGGRKIERIYLGAVEIYRERQGDNPVDLERQTVHISDDTGRIAQVDIKTKDDNNRDPANPLHIALIRYQYTNHLGSAVLETDKDGNPISYEEYHPYGTSAYRSAKSGFDLSLKRYRFSGKERDDETGLYYFGARYYAPWLRRWSSTDPSGLSDGFNGFRYCHNNPINVKDAQGLEGERIYQLGQDFEQDIHTNTPEARARIEGALTGRIVEENGILYQIDRPSIEWRGDEIGWYFNARSSDISIVGESITFEDEVITPSTPSETPAPPEEPTIHESATTPSEDGSSEGISDSEREGALDAVQTALDVFSMTDIPIASQAADLINAGISLGRGDYLGAGLGLAAMIPAIGSAATAARMARRASHVVEAGVDVARAVERTTDTVRAVDRVTDAARTADISESGFTTFYHGTSREAADAIRNGGIDLAFTRPGADFGRGFYMSTSREVAEFAASKIPGRTSIDIVEFRVPNAELQLLDSLPLNAADGAWSDFVRFHRTLEPETLAHGGRYFDMVSGPMFARFGRDGSVRALSNAGQTSIHTDRAVDLFNIYMLR